jgi:predicted TIM-barrel fold metal-dependent hydrolase
MPSGAETRGRTDMIIDAHTHIYPDRVAHRALRNVIGNIGGHLDAFTDGTRDSLLASMDAAGVDHSLVLTVATSPGQGEGILEWIRRTAPLSDRLVFFGSVHPHAPGFRACLRGMAAAGVQGVKFHPGYQDFPADSPAAYAVYEEAAALGLVLYFHAGYDPSLPGCEHASIQRLARLVRDFAGAKIILAHGGGYGEWDRVLDLLGGKGCYFDTAFVLESMKERADARELYRQNEDFFLFGTDSPWRDQKHYVELIRTSETLTADQKEKLFSGNIRKLIRIGGNP